MKKTILVVTAAAIAFNLYAFDTASTLKPAVGVKDYTKTDYTITEKLLKYFITKVCGHFIFAPKIMV